MFINGAVDKGNLASLGCGSDRTHEWAFPPRPGSPRVRRRLLPRSQGVLTAGWEHYFSMGQVLSGLAWDMELDPTAEGTLRFPGALDISVPLPSLG